MNCFSNHPNPWPVNLGISLPSSYHMLVLQPITDEKNVWDNQSAEPSVYGG